MANSNVERMNRLIRSAPDLYRYYSRQYLNDFMHLVISFDVARSNVYGDMIFYRLLKYREYEDRVKTTDNLSRTMNRMLSFSYASGTRTGYFVLNKGGYSSVYYASEPVESFTSDFRQVLESSVPDIRLSAGFVDNDFLKQYASCGGVITGMPGAVGGEIDAVIDAMKGENFLMAVLAEPVSSAGVRNKINELNSLIAQFESVSSVQRTFGHGTRRVIETKIGPVGELLKQLNSLLEYYQASLNKGLFRTCIWYAAGDDVTADRLSGHIAGAFSGRQTEGLELLRSFKLSHTPFAHEKPCIAAPDCFLYLPSPEYMNDIGDSLTTLLSTEQLISWIMPPLRSHNGLEVINTSVESDVFHDFDINPPIVPVQNAFRLGTVVGSGADYLVPLQRMTEHVFVAGASGSGKTNTVMNLLINLDQRNIPFIVIEPIEKEYWRLAGRIRNLNVYSAGADAIPLVINPLEPEDGTWIGNHIDALLNALKGAFDMESPLPEVLTGLMVKTYRDFGWETDMQADRNKGNYPTLSDLYENIEEYVDKDVSHGAEVKGNIRGAAKVRIGSLVQGPVGRAVNVKSGISAKQLLTRHSIIELDDLSHDSKIFVTNVLTIKLNEYLRCLPPVEDLKQVLVIEEAHNIFTAAPSRDSRNQSSKSVASEYFANMLSEIRALGTGMVIADQRPSQINSNAIANTAIKIIHAMNDREDIDKVSSSLGLSDYRSRLMRSLPCGEAVVAIRGEQSTCKVKVDSVKRDLDEGGYYPCIMCNDKMRCTGARMDALVAAADKNRFAYDFGVIRREYKEYKRFKEAVDRMVEALGGPMSGYEKACLFGKLLALDTRCSDTQKRRMIHEYKDLTVRG